MAQKRHYSWLINPQSGDYEISRGNPIRDESLQFPAYARLKIQRQSWMYAPDADYGSDFSTVRKRTATTPTLLQSIGTRALQPIIDDGRASDATFSSVQNTSGNRNSEEMLCSIMDNDDNILSFELTPVGV
jgi:phage gp46-like protein